MRSIKEYVEMQKILIKNHYSGTSDKPSLLIVQVGNNEASNRYVNNKIKDLNEVGFKSCLIKYNGEERNFYEFLENTISNFKCDGVIVQLPLPEKYDLKKIQDIIPLDKDVDGFKLGSPYEPCTPAGIKDYLGDIGVWQNLAGKNALVIGRSNIVGKPMAKMLLAADATVTVAHSKTPQDRLLEYVQQADLIVCAVGKKKFLDCNFVKDSAMVVDVGINFNEVGKLVGDCFNTEGKNVTPVPGGVGLLTRLALLKNVKKAHEEE